MHVNSALPTRRIFGLCLTFVLAALIVMLAWFSAQAEGAPAPLAPLPQGPEGQAILAQVQSPDVMTNTIFLPVVSRAYKPSRPVFGVEMHRISTAGGLTSVKATDTRWIRFRAFLWNEIEPVRTNPPTYLWSAVDEASLIAARNNGLSVIATIHMSPRWALRNPDDKYLCGQIDEEALDEFAQFLRAVVTRYSAPPYNVKYWELGNEPDIDPILLWEENIYGCWGDATDPYYGGGYYARMLKMAYPAIKAVDPTAQVLIGGLLLDCDPRDPTACTGASHRDLPPKFLEGILRAGGGPYFDIVGFHAYARYAPEQPQKMTNFTWPGSVTSVPEKAQFIREVLNKYGFGQKPLMNTEVALQCTIASVDCLEGQAMYIPKAYGDAMAVDLKAQVYFAITSNWYNTGLLNKDLTPKPVYNAYKTASNYLGDAVYRGAATGYPVGITGHAFGFMGVTRRIDVIWSQDGTQKAVALPVGSSAYNRYGTLLPGAAIPVTYEPVYVIRP